MDSGMINGGAGPNEERFLRRRRRFKRQSVRALRNAAMQSCAAYLNGQATQEFLDFVRKFLKAGLSEAEYFELIVHVIYADNPMTCDNCHGTEFKRAPGVRFGRCTNCRKIKWVTAESYFRHIKSATLTVAMFGLIEHGIIFNPHQFACAFDCSYDTASRLFTKIQYAIAKESSREIAVELINSRAFKNIVTRRSWQTPAQCFADAEQESAEECEAAKRQQVEPVQNEAGDENNDGDGDGPGALGGAAATEAKSTTSFSPPSEPTLNEEDRKIFAEIQQFKLPISFDVLLERCQIASAKLSSSLTILELEGLISAVPGGRFALAKSEAALNALGYCGDKPMNAANNSLANSELALVGGPTPKYLQRLADAYVLLMKLVHQGISRKKLPLYLASYLHIFRVKRTGVPLPLYEICKRSDWGSRADFRAIKCPFRLQIFAPGW